MNKMMKLLLSYFVAVYSWNPDIDNQGLSHTEIQQTVPLKTKLKKGLTFKAGIDIIYKRRSSNRTIW